MKKFLFVVMTIQMMASVCSGQNDRVMRNLEKQYYHVFYDSNCNQYTVADRDWKQGVCDANGNVVFKPKYDNVYIDQNADCNWYQVELNDKVGYCDAKGNEIIPPVKYTDVFFHKDFNVFYVAIGKLNGLCDAHGKELVPPLYSEVVYQSDHYVVKNGDKEGWYSKDGKLLIAPTKYTFIWYDERANMYRVSNGDKTGYCDSKWKEVISPECDEVVYCEDNGFSYFLVRKNSKSGLVDSQGQAIAQLVYDSLYSSTEELCRAKWQGKWGYISIKDGSVMVPFEYDKVSAFKDGVAKVIKNGQTVLLPNPTKAVAQNTNQPKVKGKAVSTFPAPDSDVDKDIPMGKKADSYTHAFIIANENYPVAKVPYALNDGWMFEQYCKKTLGLKEENVHLYEDATGGNIMACVEEMKQTAKAANGQATIIFYYAGHAFPDEEKSTAYLLPVDGDSKNPSTGYSLEKLYKEMNGVQAKQMVCFLDACFSGATRDDQMLIAGRGVAIKVKDEIPQGNMVVMTSASGAETAHSYEEMHHGLFTYFLLQKLQETQGDVTLGDLSEYVTKMVKRKSVLINQKKQTPTVIPSPQLQSSWQEIKL